MKAILEFNLQEDSCDFNIAVKAMDWALAMLDMDTYLRNKLKYEDGGEDFEKMREKLYEILDDRNLSFDDID